MIEQDQENKADVEQSHNQANDEGEHYHAENFFLELQPQDRKNWNHKNSIISSLR